MRRATALALSGALVASGVMMVPRQARAVGEDEWQVSARLGAANATGFPTSSWGPAGALDVEYGFLEAFAARASLGVLEHPVPAVKNVTKGGTLRATTALAGVTYTFDVLRLVPYISVDLGLVQWSGGGLPAHNSFAAETVIGADYLLTTRWAWGASAQYIFAPADLYNNYLELGENPLAFSFTLRLSRIF
ncbi:MAG TPA: hypothetical protein VH560_12405 [Polyangia bacterium]|nr:hypothetical protein [Polyangia bacterium]